MGYLIMTFKNYLRGNKSKKAQAALEYFIIFAVVAALTLVSLASVFLDNVRNSGKDIFNKAAVRILGA